MDERGIIKRCLKGEIGEFRQIVDRYTPPLMAAAMTVLGNRQDAEDICQETFIQAYRHLSSFDTQRSLRIWLYTILYRRCLNAAKRKKLFVGILNRLKTEPQTWLQASNPGPDESQLLPPGLYRTLSPRERMVLSLWANEGYTTRDISEILGCSASTARVTLFNARMKIKSFLENEHGVLQNC
jgi:RNA polymerase sigma-70 factor (ECF subfamily)